VVSEAQGKPTSVPMLMIKGYTRESVDAALLAIRGMVDRASIKKCTFRFDASQASLCNLLEEKVKEFGRNEPSIAVTFVRHRKPDSSSSLEISTMGSDEKAVEQLVQRHNHI